MSSEKNSATSTDLQHEKSQQSPVPVDNGQKVEVANADFAAAMAQKPISPWSSGSMKLYCICALVYLCSTMNGYDSSLMSSTNALPSYTSYYSLPSQGSSGTGLVFAIFNIGGIAGAFFIWTADWLGRRFLIFVGCLGVCIATIVTSTAPTLSVFIGGRFLLSFFAGVGTNAGSLYIVEIAPPAYRGTVAGLFNTLYYMGSIIATFAIYGAHLHLADRGNLDWRLPLWLQMVCPSVVCMGIWFVPESPRWLVGKGNVDEARTIIARYHADGDSSHPLVNLEMAEITTSLREVGLSKPSTFFDLSIMFNTRSARYRTMINMAMSWFGQFSGNNVISYYLPSLLQNVGITDTSTLLILNAIYALIGWFFATLGARCHDIFGRRQMFLWSVAGLVLCLSITAGTAAGYVHTSSIASSRASIAFIYIFGAIFAFSWTSMQPLYPIEVMSNRMRAKGVFIFQITASVSGFVNTFAAPVALKNIGYWFYVFFVFWDMFEFVFIYLFFVETKGRTLEEMDEVFEAKNPRKRSLEKVEVTVGRSTSIAGEEGKVVGR